MRYNHQPILDVKNHLFISYLANAIVKRAAIKVPCTYIQNSVVNSNDGNVLVEDGPDVASFS